MELVDTHCHPHFADLAAEPARVITEAAEAGVSRLIVVGTSLPDSQSALTFASDHKNVWAAAGVHPHAAGEFVKFSDAAVEFRELLTKPKIVAVGEIGLDLYKSYSMIKDQEAALRTQIEEGLSTGLPFIFHIRDAWEAFWPVFDSYKGLRGVVHSFSAYEEQLQQILERGLYIGLNGIMTFTKDEKQLAAAKHVPLDKLLLETDAPFLTPKPYRGQRCEPKHVRNVAEFLAHLRSEPLEELAAATTNNAKELFNLK